MSATTDVLAEALVHGAELRELVYGDGALPRHVHDKAGFCVVLDGSYEERYGGRTLVCGAHTITFSPAGEEHTNVFASSRSHCLTIDVPAAWVDRLDGSRAKLAEPFQTRGGALASLGERLLGEVRDGGDGSTLIIEGVVLEMLGEAVRAASRTEAVQISPAIRRAYDLLQANFREELSLADVAVATGRHPVYIATAFRAAYGETIGDCRRRLRVEYAAAALARTDTPLVEVGLDAGFASQSHFTRTFKRATGLTPAAYRLRHRA